MHITTSGGKLTHRLGMWRLNAVAYVHFQVPVSRDVFFVDVRYTNLKPIGGGSYGFVCSADDALTGEKVRRPCLSRVGTG